MPDSLLSGDLAQIALLLDIDGTLLDIASTPRQVHVPPDLRETLAHLSEQTGGAVALVSGRPLTEIDLLFAPLRLPGVGEHGAEVRLGGAEPIEVRAKPLDPTVKRMFAAIAEVGPGILIEDKSYSVALHYRLAPQHERLIWERAAHIQASLTASGIELLPGKMLLEVKQSGCSKARAVRELLARQPFAGRRPIFLGDDVTDKGVFALMPEVDGVGISVGERDRYARFHFEHPADVRLWLGQLSRGNELVAIS